MTFKEKYFYYESNFIHWLKPKSEKLLFLSYGIIYIWYGFLKVIGISSAETLVLRATDWIFTHEFVVVLGFWEVLLGFFLLIPSMKRIGLLLLFLQFPGTFMPLITNPEDCFTSFPFGLTLEGQYIFKNLILIAGGLVLVSSLHIKKSRHK